MFDSRFVVWETMRERSLGLWNKGVRRRGGFWNERGLFNRRIDVWDEILWTGKRYEDSDEQDGGISHRARGVTSLSIYEKRRYTGHVEDMERSDDWGIGVRVSEEDWMSAISERKDKSGDSLTDQGGSKFVEIRGAAVWEADRFLSLEVSISLSTFSQSRGDGGSVDTGSPEGDISSYACAYSLGCYRGEVTSVSAATRIQREYTL
ncbi:hypothetical protein Tco_0777703 [Tanacetum coccineum]